MPAIRLKHVHRFTDRHGHARHYLRIPGRKAVALPGAPGSPAFIRAYNAALAALPSPVAEARTVPGSLDALAVSYYAAEAFTGLRATTQRAYRNIIEGMRAKHGTKPVRLLDAQGVARIMGEKAGTPTAANHRLRILSGLMRHAIALGWRKDNPCTGVERHRYRSDGYAPWSEGDIALFRAKHPSGSVARLALELLLNTGQRRSDVVRMGKQHVQGGAIRVRQVKTGAEVTVPILPELRTELDAIGHGHLTFLALADGTARSPRGFYNTFRDWCREAGVPDGRSPHGLRKACGNRLADAGCSAHEIMAVLGHKTLSEAQRYTEAADKRRLGESAMAKVRRLREG